MNKNTAPVTTKRKSPSTRPAHMPMTEARKEAFLKTLEECGVLTWAARAASPHSNGKKFSLTSFKDEMRRNPEFRAHVEEAQQIADANLLKTARERAIRGIPRYVVQKGQIVKGPDGKTPLIEHHVSDRLLEVMLKSRFPNDFVEKRQIEHSGNVNHTANAVAAISLTDLDALSPAQRNQLAGLLKSIQKRRQLLAGDGADVIDADYEMIEEPEEEELSEAEEIERILS